MSYPSDALTRLADETPVTISAAAARRIREALAQSEYVLRQVERAAAHRLSGAARTARSEIGAAVAHLDRANPPTDAAVITGARHDAA